MRAQHENPKNNRKPQFDQKVRAAYFPPNNKPALRIRAEPSTTETPKGFKYFDIETKTLKTKEL